jgi:hypothetical protein
MSKRLSRGWKVSEKVGEAIINPRAVGWMKMDTAPDVEKRLDEILDEEGAISHGDRMAILGIDETVDVEKRLGELTDDQ